jgi:hypothetical protein
MEQDLAATNDSKRGRIVAFDIIRGFFLVVILINHIELYPSGFDYFTGRGRLLVSAAEGFFFMSGLLVGLVYRRKIVNGMRYIFKKMWTRAAELYFGSVILTLLFTAAAVFFNHPNIKDGLMSVINWPHIVKETMLMRYGFGWADFLDRFAILTFLAPFGFYLITKGKWWLLMAISLIAWAFRGNGFTLSWQIIFALGMVLGYYWYELRALIDRMRSITRRRLQSAVFWVSGITFALSYASVYALSVLNDRWSSLPAFWQSFTFHWNSINAWVWLYAQKWTMGPVRIVLFMFWFTALFMIVERNQDKIYKLTRGYVDLLGRNSLFVYITHAFIVFGFKLFIPPATNLWQNFLITAGALALLFYATNLYSKYLIRRKASTGHTRQHRQRAGRGLKPEPAES